MGNTTRSAVAEHQLQHGNHRMDTKNAEIIYRNDRYYPRIIREAIEIIKTPNNINRDEGYTLSKTWKSFLKKDQRSKSGRGFTAAAEPIRTQSERTKPGIAAC